MQSRQRPGEAGIVGSTMDPAGPVGALGALVARAGVVVLSGAGLSTESGIPDYRGPNGSLQRHTPMTYQEFNGSEAAQRRYWGRSHVGWRHFVRARPNAGHMAVAALERGGLVDGVITQNVDGLHQGAGSRRVVELHGSLGRVLCLSCGSVSSRAALAARLHVANRDFERRADAFYEVNPDGDADLSDEELRGFQLVGCQSCGRRTLKADVVFFGETVPRTRVEECFAMVDDARLLLVLGSSLTVMSGYRFVLHAVRRGIPVAIVNQGPTRGDGHAHLKVDVPLGQVLTGLVAMLAERGASMKPGTPLSRPA